MRPITKLVAVGLLAVGLAACGGDDDSTDETTGSVVDSVVDSALDTMPNPTDAPAGTEAAASGTIQVPDDYPTIQEAVDAAAPGDLILIAPGTYEEAVSVTTDDLTIRGLDRKGVVLEGGFELANGIMVVGANGVAVENMTAQNYTANGFYWTGTTGYRGSYLTALRNGDYGIYAFDSVQGQFDHSYAAGSPDAGFYIGQCYPCDALITDVVSEHNGLGYSGTNSGGNLVIVNSVFRNNRAGVVPNSGSYELCYPERDTTVVGNIVHSNNQPDTPAIDVAILAMGNGILVAGGVNNVIERNLVYDHTKTGIGLVPFLEEDPNDDLPTEDEWATPCEETKDDVPASDVVGPILWNAIGNRVIGNVAEANGVADLAVASVDTDLSTLGNCFSDNVAATTAPADLQTLAPCDGAVTGDWTVGAIDIASWLVDAETAPPSVDYRSAPLPDPPAEAWENMPDAETAPARPATDVPEQVDLASITVPAKPAG
jgi:hypothetical protein